MPPERLDPSHWFAAEVQVHQGTLRAWLRSRFPELADPDDVVQEAMSRVWRASGRQEVLSPKALLFTTAQNLALDQMRRRQVVRMEPVGEMGELSVSVEANSPAESAAHNQELEFLTQAIQSLPDRCRQVLTLRKIYGLSQKEISAQLGIAEHTVEAHVANGMRRCAEFLRRFGLP